MAKISDMNQDSLNLTPAEYLPDWLMNEPERAKAYLSVIGTNMLLLDPQYVDFEGGFGGDGGGGDGGGDGGGGGD